MRSKEASRERFLCTKYLRGMVRKARRKDRGTWYPRNSRVFGRGCMRSPELVRSLAALATSKEVQYQQVH